MPTVSMRLDKDTLKEVEFLMKELKADKSEVMRRLLDKGLKQAKIEKVIEMLREHKISIGKAAELAGVTLYEIIDLCKQKDIPLGYTVEDLKRDVKRFNL